MRTVTAAGMFLLYVSAWNLAQASEILQPGHFRQMFFDDTDIASRTGLERVWHQPVRNDAPVLTRERSWEGSGPYVYGTVMRDPKAGQFKMWYNCYVGGRPDYFACYATSADGLRWDRPALNAVKDPRLPDGHNVVMLGSGLPNYRQCLSPTVFFRPEESDPDRRYAMVYWDINAGEKIEFVGLCVAWSPDGIHWENHPGNPIFVGTSDVTDACWDPIRKRYLLHYKTWRVEGEVTASDVPFGSVRSVSYWPTWDTEKLEGSKVRYKGQVTDYSAEDTRPKMGSADFAREPVIRRVVARAESEDLIHWSNARLIFELPEDNDPPNLSTYGMSVYPYEGIYVGLLRVFHGDRQIDLELAHSRDDLNWKRTTPGSPFLPLRTGSHFDTGMVFSSNSLVCVGDELWFYYGAFTGDHAAAEDKQSGSTGLARLRREGFVSLVASDSPGELITVPLRCDGEQLNVNATASRGQISVEIRDPDGGVYPGFTYSDCDLMKGDAVAHRVSWRGKSDLSEFAGRPVRLAFRLQNAEIYAWQLTEGAEQTADQ